MILFVKRRNFFNGKITMKNIALGSDHAGYELKEVVKKHLEDNGYLVIDFGTGSAESVDYPAGESSRFSHSVIWQENPGTVRTADHFFNKP